MVWCSGYGSVAIYLENTTIQQSFFTRQSDLFFQDNEGIPYP